jgi:hypothetical protein
MLRTAPTTIRTLLRSKITMHNTTALQFVNDTASISTGLASFFKWTIS